MEISFSENICFWIQAVEPHLNNKTETIAEICQSRWINYRIFHNISKEGKVTC